MTRKVMIAVGIGCRSEASAAEITTAIAAALETAQRNLDEVSGLFTADFKAEQPALREAATGLGKPIAFLSLEQLKRHAKDVHTRSTHVMERWGLPSVAETAALAGAQALADDRVRLLGPRSNHGSVTCALATQE